MNRNSLAKFSWNGWNNLVEFHISCDLQIKDSWLFLCGLLFQHGYPTESYEVVCSWVLGRPFYWNVRNPILQKKLHCLNCWVNWNIEFLVWLVWYIDTTALRRRSFLKIHGKLTPVSSWHKWLLSSQSKYFCN